LRGAEPARFFLELDLTIERGGVTAVLFDFGNGIWGENASTANLPAGPAMQTVRLALPERPIRGLRFDPVDSEHEVVVHGVRLVRASGEVLLRLDPRQVRPLNHIAALTPEGGALRIRPSGNDPILRLDVESLQKALHDASGRATVGAVGVALLGVGIAASLAAAVFAACRAIGGGGSGWILAALFLFVFGARVAWLDVHSRPVPFWDELEGDLLYVQIPFAGGFLDWGALVMPQWEHRILFTRVVGLVGTLLNGEWDPRVAMTVSAALYATTIALLGALLWRVPHRLGPIAAVGLAAAAALPFDFNNLLWGGQTQMYALVLLAVCAVAIASAPQVTPALACGALGASALSLWTMGAGPLGLGCATGICLVRCAFEREQRRGLAALAGIFFGGALAGVFLHVSSRAHVPFYATSLAQFQRAFLGVLSWPLPPHLGSAALLWLPWLVTGSLILRRRGGTPIEWIATGLGMWAFINAVALGYARQYEGPPFDSRFFTPISLGALACLCSTVGLLLRARTVLSSVAVATPWAAVTAGLLAVGINGLTGARENSAARSEHDHRIRTYLSSGNAQPLLEKPPNHSGGDVVERFDSPVFRRVMPAPYRRALLAGDPARAAKIQAGPLTMAVRRVMQAGPWLALAGVATLGAAFWREQRERVRHAPAGGAVRSRADRIQYAAVIVLTIGWVWVYNRELRSGLVDEGGHVANVQHFLEGKPGWPEAMPMLPGYHFAVASVWRWVPTLDTTTVSRWTTASLSLLGFAAFALAWTRLHRAPAGRATLLFALLPLTQPFTGMAYTDMPALALALAAWWAQLRGLHAFAALTLVGAVALRQTNLAWAGFFIAWEWLRPDAPRSTFLRRSAWLFALLAAAAIAIAAAGRLTVGSQHGNQFTFNIATLHTLGLLVALLGLPVWIAQAPDAWRRMRESWTQRRSRLLVQGGAAATAVVVLALTFANPHLWNRELFWDGCTFTLLRNWPLVWLERHPWLQVVSALNIVFMTGALAAVFRSQRYRRELWLALAIGVLPAFTNGLVEPRYFIPAAGFLLCLLEIPPADARRLGIWWGALTLLHAPFVVRALSLW
jgi:hypothetical protein